MNKAETAGTMVPTAYRDKKPVPLGSLSTLVLRIWAAQAICRTEWKRYSHTVTNRGPQAEGVADTWNAESSRKTFASY
jgi:hypothetical protein